MDTQTLDAIREVFHNGSIALLVFGIGLAIIGLVKPRVFSKIFHEFSRRRYIVLTAIFVCLLASTVFTVTEPAPQTLHSNAPTPTTHSTEDAASLNTIQEESLPEGNTTTTPESQTTTATPAGQANQGQTEATAITNTPASTQSSSQTTSTPAPQPKSANGKEIKSQPKDCRLELLFLCL